MGKEWLPFMVEFVAGLGVQPRGAGGLVLITERDGNPTLLVQTGRGGGGDLFPQSVWAPLPGLGGQARAI